MIPNKNYSTIIQTAFHIFRSKISYLVIMKLLGLFLILTFTMSCQSDRSPSHYQRSWSELDRTYLLENLDASLKLVLNEVDSLNETQWNWKTYENKWSIAQVIEHLIVHDEMFYRDTRVLTGLPTMTPQEDSLFSEDDLILSYREITPQNTGEAPPYLEPLGRWCSKEDAVFAYSRVRKAMIEFVRSTDKDFRKLYTSSGRGPTAYRDLHQLLLISVAHTQRHLLQIKKIKSSNNFPGN